MCKYLIDTGKTHSKIKKKLSYNLANINLHSLIIVATVHNYPVSNPTLYSFVYVSQFMSLCMYLPHALWW